MTGTAQFFTGTYTMRLPHVKGTAKGIERFELALDTGKLARVPSGVETPNPSYLCWSQKPQLLYAANELSTFRGRAEGGISVFEVELSTGALVPHGSAGSAGTGPACLHLDATGRWLLIANYGGGNVAVLRVNEGGTLGSVVSEQAHHGTGPNLARQKAPHPHCFVTTPCNKFAYAVDLGTDELVAYRFDEDTGAINRASDFDVVVPAGSGPRHLTFSPNGDLACLVLELSSELLVYRVNAGRLNLCSRASTLPPAVATGIGAAENTAAEVRISRCGTRAYVSNRGHDSITVFHLDPASGALTTMQHIRSGGFTPRNFALSPDGNFLVVANQDSGNLVSYRVSAADGTLRPTGHQVTANSPSFVLFTRP